MAVTSAVVGDCQRGAASTRGGVYSSVLHGMKILLFVPNSTMLTYTHCNVFELLPPAPPLLFTWKSQPKWFPPIRARSHALVELVLGSNPRGGGGLGKGALLVASFIPVELELQQAPSLLAAVWRPAE